MFCRPYKIRGFKNKGGLLTLLWSYCGFLFIFYIFEKKVATMKEILVASLVVYPIAGWLADVWYGRYKVIRISLCIGLVASVCYNFFLIANYLSKTFRGTQSANILESFIAVVGLVGFSGFQANVLQFGIDQFIDASSTEISSYISWYVWVVFVSRCSILFSQVHDCLEGHFKHENMELSFLLISFMMSVAVISDFLFNKWLIKEPVVHNPLRLIFQVLKYAVKNKYPRLRSAFTYWEDKPYARLDLGKAKYGGPFTTEEVEDVKTFFRILFIVSVASIIFGLCLILDSVFESLTKHYTGGSIISDDLENCYKHKGVISSANILVVAFIPFFEFVLYPLFRKCNTFSKLKIMYRFLLGILLLGLYELCIMSIEITAIYSSSNHNSTCFLFYELHKSTQPQVQHVPVLMDYRWLMLSRGFSTGSMYLLITSSIEFIYAQAPYSMKGLLAGIIYCWVGVMAGTVLSLWNVTLRKAADKVSSGPISNLCGVWFYASALAFTLLLFLIGIGFVKWYTFRRRDENIHNEQIFAVDYFDRYNASPSR